MMILGVISGYIMWREYQQGSKNENAKQAKAGQWLLKLPPKWGAWIKHGKNCQKQTGAPKEKGQCAQAAATGTVG